MTDNLAIELTKDQQEAIDKFNGLLGPIIEAAKLEIKDQADLVKSGDAKISLESYIKSVKAYFAPELDPLEERVKRIKNNITSLTTAAKTSLDDLVDRQRTWSANEKQRAEADTKRKQEELRRQQVTQADQDRREAERAAAEAKREKIGQIEKDYLLGLFGKREYAKRLKEAGAEEEAAIATAAAVAEEQKNAPPPEVRVVPNIPKVAGVKNQTFYYVELLPGGDQAIITAFASACAQKDRDRAKFLWRFLTVNEKEIGAFTRDTKDSEKVMQQIPGVKAFSKG